MNTVMPARTEYVSEQVSPSSKASQQTANVSKYAGGSDLKTTQVVAQIGGDELENTVREIGDLVQKVQHNLSFSLDDDSGRSVVKVIDRETEEVIKQIPSEEVLNLSRKIEEMVGLLLEDKA